MAACSIVSGSSYTLALKPLWLYSSLYQLCVIFITTYPSNGIRLIDVPKDFIRQKHYQRSKVYHKHKARHTSNLVGEMFLRRADLQSDMVNHAKDNLLKEKIGFLIDQTINDANKEFESVSKIKGNYNTTSVYRIGFLMYMVKRSRDVMNELFNVAVAHKDEWKALDQLKIFELIVHTNVDTSNLLRQLLEVAQDPWKVHEPDALRNLKVALL